MTLPADIKIHINSILYCSKPPEMMRTFANLTIRSLSRTLFFTKLPSQSFIRYDFAKVSKKDEQKMEKKKEKSRVKE